MNPPLPGAASAIRQSAATLAARLTPRQHQFALLAAILAGGVGLLWLVFASSGDGGTAAGRRPAGGAPASVTNIGIMPAGQQVSALDQWVGAAGSKLAQYERERDEQDRLNRDRQAFEARTMQRFAELEQRLGTAARAAQDATPAVPPLPPALPAPPAAPAFTTEAPAGFPPAAGLPLAPVPAAGAGQRPVPAAGTLAQPEPAPAVPPLTRVKVFGPAGDPAASGAGATGALPGRAEGAARDTVATYLPVSFVRGTLLGGLDAPTGGQAQSNPHPVLIRLSDNAVLPNRFRGEYRECFVIAAGYGDISSERAYLRTENLSCVRADGATLEVRIQGSVYGEDGKVGMRGRLVTKQGQMLANALLAGVVSGIGQGLAAASTDVSTSPLGTITSASGADAYRAGLGTGVGRALDRLAQYYIKLAENTFPVIEIDAGREIDVVITRGVRIDVPMGGAGIGVATASTPAAPRSTHAASRGPIDPQASDDDLY